MVRFDALVMCQKVNMTLNVERPRKDGVLLLFFWLEYIRMISPTRSKDIKGSLPLLRK